MDKTKTLILVVGAFAIVLVGISMMNPDYKNGSNEPEGEELGNTSEIITEPSPMDDLIGEVTQKEFTMTAFYEMKDGKPAPQFSVTELTVKKGETVRINITNTKGMHDFVIDEYSISSELPLNQQVTIEFVADKAGSFTYYCSKPGHRAAGQVGTLSVLE